MESEVKASQSTPGKELQYKSQPSFIHIPLHSSCKTRVKLINNVFHRARFSKRRFPPFNYFILILLLKCSFNGSLFGTLTHDWQLISAPDWAGRCMGRSPHPVNRHNSICALFHFFIWDTLTEWEQFRAMNADCRIDINQRANVTRQPNVSGVILWSLYSKHVFFAPHTVWLEPAVKCRAHCV